ncbi:MAG TPA: molybdopterin-dependent oxidoreductase [Bryobacteraceae bacterium]
MPDKRPSVCALDCPDACSLLVDIDQDGKATRLRGDPSHPITRGFLCAKVTKYLEREYHPDRLLHPLRRTGAKGEGRFERINWDEALDEIAGKLKAISETYGPEAILPYSYAGTMGLLNGSGMDRRFFHRLGASRLDRTICSAAGGAALQLSQGIRLGMEPDQFAHSRLILAWGANILGTNIHLWPWIVEARRKGAKFYVIDPVRNRTARTADKHFAVNPGSDLALALGLMHVILRESLHDQEYIYCYANGFEELARLAQEFPPARVSELTGIAAPEIELLAREYASIQPAAIRVNYGVQRSERGGTAVRAIAALPVLTGAWRKLGGGLQLTTSGAFAFNRAALERPDLQFRSPLGRPARLVNMAQLGHALLELDHPRVKALMVYNSNPAAIAPHQSRVIHGLRRSDLFTVVLEQFLTDTARHAEIVLPVTTFLEHTDLYLAYGHYYLQLARPALKGPVEVKSNVEIFRLLAERMGFDDSCFRESDEDMIRGALANDSRYFEGVTFERLEQERSIRLNVAPPGEPFLPFAKGKFRTPSGRFEFGAESLAYHPPEESRHGKSELVSRYPLELISAKNDDSMNSTFGHRRDVDAQTAWLSIHPDDADTRGIVQDMLVRVANDRGSCFFVASVNNDVARGVVSARSVRWNMYAPEQRGVNQLTAERLTDIGDGPTFYSCLVEVTPVLPSYGSARTATSYSDTP